MNHSKRSFVFILIMLSSATAEGGSTCHPVWQPLGEGFSEAVISLATHPEESQRRLCAGGHFISSGSERAFRIAQWNGSAWTQVGNGLNAPVHSLLSIPGDSATTLIAGGQFTQSIGEASGQFVTRWDGRQWQSLDASLGGCQAPSPTNHPMELCIMRPIICGLTWFDLDGEGPQDDQLIAAGNFRSSGDQAMWGLAAWNGSAWQALDESVTIQFAVLSVDVTVFEEPALFTTGSLTAQWRDGRWQELGAGLGSGSQIVGRALAVYDDAAGPALYVGGRFTAPSGVPASNIARWDGATWSALPGFDAPVHVLHVFDDGTGAPPRLIAGGRFTTAGGVPANRIAAYRCLAPADINADGLVNGIDLGILLSQ